MEIKKVLFVATVVKKHINVFHLPYLKWFKEQGYETHVCARDDFNGEACIIPYCDKFFDTLFERSPINKNNIKAYKQLKNIINENDYDIIHCHTPVAAMLTRLAARKSRKKSTKVIYTAHGFHFFKGAPLKNWLIYFPVEWICSFWTDTLITINQEDYNLAQKLMYSKRVEYVCGVGVNNKDIEKEVNTEEKRKELGIPQEKKILLSIGEISHRKNHRTIIEALSMIRRDDIHYVICGHGDLLKDLKTLSNNLSIENKVTFLGFRTDIVEICKVADIFIFPSLQEGLPVSLMEGMMAGLPCIVSNIRGNRDLIVANKGGLLCNPYDVEAFGKGIEQLIDDSELMLKMGEYNREIVKKYDLEKVKQNMSTLYMKDLS